VLVGTAYAGRVTFLLLEKEDSILFELIKSPEALKSIVRVIAFGQHLYPRVLALVGPPKAGQITGMILEKEDSALSEFLKSPEALKSIVAEAIEVIEAAATSACGADAPVGWAPYQNPELPTTPILKEICACATTGGVITLDVGGAVACGAVQYFTTEALVGITMEAATKEPSAATMEASTEMPKGAAAEKPAAAATEELAKIATEAAIQEPFADTTEGSVEMTTEAAAKEPSDDAFQGPGETTTEAATEELSAGTIEGPAETTTDASLLEQVRR